MRLRISISCPSVGPSAGPSRVIFESFTMAVFKGKKSSNDIINNDTMSDDEVVASYDVIYPRGTCSPRARPRWNMSFYVVSFAVSPEKR